MAESFEEDNENPNGQEKKPEKLTPLINKAEEKSTKASLQKPPATEQQSMPLEKT